MPKILLVEDDRTHARLVGAWLTHAGHEVTIESGVRAALARAAEPWDAVISDVQLEDGEGTEIAARMKAMRPDLPVILLTASPRVDIALAALRSRVDDVLLKLAPLRPADLCNRVDALIAAARVARRSTTNEVILAIGAHPDDVEIGCGGVLARHAERGDTIIMVSITGGEGGGDPSIRNDEAGQAARRLGATFVLGDQRDQRVSEGPETIALLEQVIRDHSPSTMFIHAASDTHQDHRNTHRAAMVAARRIPTVYAYQSPSTTVEFRPSRFVDIGRELPTKLELIGCHSSQTSHRSYLDPELIAATARYWGRFNQSMAAEPFEVIRSSRE
jgi:LmbE family N-acetylglucosaminyl deacetylase/CheY-like chemotaxis protein